jgi:DNA-binding transcriptional regulator YdaS (Cro superfamily)
LDAVFVEYGVTTTEVATSLGVSNEAVRLWRRGQRRLGTEQARLIEERFSIPRHLLRPDVWDAPPSRRRRRAAETAS